jgi:hypothetical protein
MPPQPVILESQNATSVADSATIERRIRISQPDERRGRCKGSRAWDRRKDFSQCMQQHKIPSTSNAISPQQERTEPSGPQPCRRGAKSSPRREPPRSEPRTAATRSRMCQRPRTHKRSRAAPSRRAGFSHAQRDKDVKIARVTCNGRRRETACLRLLAMREFDRWGRRGPVEGPHRFKIAASTFLDRKIIQETRFRA